MNVEYVWQNIRFDLVKKFQAKSLVLGYNMLFVKRLFDQVKQARPREIIFFQETF